MGIISVEQADRLYWLGRYTERVYTTLRMFCQSFDTMIDEIGDSYSAFCKKIDIPDIYGDKDTFLKVYPFDQENPDSIISNLDRAYDNAVVLRESIGGDADGERVGRCKSLISVIQTNRKRSVLNKAEFDNIL